MVRIDTGTGGGTATVKPSDSDETETETVDSGEKFRRRLTREQTETRESNIEGIRERNPTIDRFIRRMREGQRETAERQLLEDSKAVSPSKAAKEFGKALDRLKGPDIAGNVVEEGVTKPITDAITPDGPIVDVAAGAAGDVAGDVAGEIKPNLRALALWVILGLAVVFGVKGLAEGATS